MYICCDEECKLIFDKPVVYSEDRTPGGVCEGGSFIEYFEGCPNCEGAFKEYIEDEEREDEDDI